MSGQRVSIHPVIHVESMRQVLEDVEVVTGHESGIVFLISHKADDELLLDTVAAVRDEHPHVGLGINMIRRPAHIALELVGHHFAGEIPLDAIWADTAGIETGRGVEFAARLTALRDEFGWRGTHFGGLAFKHQEPVADDDLPGLCRAAAPLVDVPTTSGAATGHAAPVERVEAMSLALAGGRLALASGVDAQNVSRFTPFVSDILVATGISTNGRIDPHRLDELLAAAGE